VILAGGIRPENVRLAITEVRPFAVDVASGVEVSPGKKDPGALRALMREVEIGNRTSYDSQF
jgi:phosphoribosylanthranilate isomerase